MNKFDDIRAKTNHAAILTLGLVLISLMSACANEYPPEVKTIEIIPEISLTTTEGRITSAKFLDDSKGEFLLFISPN